MLPYSYSIAVVSDTSNTPQTDIVGSLVLYGLVRSQDLGMHRLVPAQALLPLVDAFTQPGLVVL